jgi:hypothetical protein
VVYDPAPEVRYRQHGANLSGSNRTVLAQLGRIKQGLMGSFTEMNDMNLAALNLRSVLLTEANRKALAAFAALRRGKGLLRPLREIRRNGFLRRPLFQQILLYLAAIMRRI